MDTLFKELLQDLFGQGSSQKYVYISLIILVVGLPYLIKTWREIFSSKHYLEVRKLQLDILKVYSDLGLLDDQAKNEMARKIADKIFNDPEIKKDPFPLMFGRSGLGETFYYVMTSLLLLLSFFLGVVVMWAPLLFMVRHNWPDFFRFLFIMFGLLFPVFIWAKTDGALRSVNAFALGTASLPIAIIVSLLMSLVSWTIESLLSVP